MQSRDFCYWLQGFFEITGDQTLSKDQVEMIRNHLNLVFKHEIDPSFGQNEYLETMKKIHSPDTIVEGACGLNTSFPSSIKIMC